jgi:hypothetical protein
MNKYQVGDEVEVSFIGKITGIELEFGKVIYKISNDDVKNNNWTYAHRVRAEQIKPLLTPEML